MAVDLGIEVSTSVSPGLHPQLIASLDEYDDDTSGYLEPAVEAFKHAYSGIAKTHLIRDAVRNDPTMTEAAQIVRTADHAEKVWKDAAARFDKVTANMQSGIAKMEAELSAPVQARAAHTISVEVRSYVRSLPDGSRMGFIRQAIERGDVDSVSAVLGGPAYLSGIEPAMQAILLRMWHEKANPVAAKRIKAMTAALDLLGTNAPLVTKELERAIGVPQHKVKAFREAKAKADKAFAS